MKNQIPFLFKLMGLLMLIGVATIVPMGNMVLVRHHGSSGGVNNEVGGDSSSSSSSRPSSGHSWQVKKKMSPSIEIHRNHHWEGASNAKPSTGDDLKRQQQQRAQEQQSHNEASDDSILNEPKDAMNEEKHSAGSDSSSATTKKPSGATQPPSQQEPTEIPFDPERPYLNPYKPMMRSERSCNKLAYTQGSWKKYTIPKKPPYQSRGEILGCCQRGWDAEHSGDKKNFRPETQYYWEPEDCDLIDWSEELFCKALKGRDLMLAGDSLNDHWHASLYYLLTGGTKDIYKREGTVAGKHACRGHPICHKYYKRPLRLLFYTNQLLEEKSMRNRNHKWWKYIRPNPILILNAGSWMRDPKNEEREVSDEEYFRHMKHAVELVKSQEYNGTIIWRTTYQGHPYCWTYEEPLTQELQEQDFPRVVPYLRYRWWMIPKRNKFATELWNKTGTHILDVTRITNLMPLGHLGKNHPKNKIKNITDCLHYCSPGPVYDTWSKLLMNLLLGNL